MSNLPAPKETRKVFEKYFDTAKNPGLIFERYTDSYGANWTLETKKKESLERVKKINYDIEFLQHIKARQDALFNNMEQLEVMKPKCFFAHPDWRFVSGLGSHSPLEVGFTFHRLYGIPIIPGSSLKGLACAFAKFGLEISNGELNTVFGTQEIAGSAIFFDALPMTPPKLELDVMNPHYPDWYQKQEAPTNWQNPNPIFFLAVGKETIFRFAVGGRGKDGPAARDNAIAWLKEALREMGIGAKTSAGYGYFSRETKLNQKESKAPKASPQTAYHYGDTEPKAIVISAEDTSWQVILPKLPDQRFKLKQKPMYSKAVDGAKIRVRVIVDKNSNIQRAEEL